MEEAYKKDGPETMTARDRIRAGRCPTCRDSLAPRHKRTDGNYMHCDGNVEWICTGLSDAGIIEELAAENERQRERIAELEAELSTAR